MIKFNEDFQLEVPRSILIKMFNCAFPEKPAINEILFIKSGRFNTTYKIHAEGMTPVILQIAPGEDMVIFEHEKLLLRREYEVHPFLSSITELTPRILFADFTRSIVNRDYLILSYIDGISGDDISMSDLSVNQELSLWRQLNEVSLKINIAKNSLFGFPNPIPGYLKWSQAISEILRGMINDLDRFSLPARFPKKLLSHIPRHKDTLDLVKTSQLIHGDLWLKNTILSKDGYNIIGMLDSERAFWGDPKTEWIIGGTTFAGQTARKGYVFRCGFFSEHFTQIPSKIAVKFQPMNYFESIRNNIYLGIYLTQRILESQRFPRKEQWIDVEFNKVITQLS